MRRGFGLAAVAVALAGVPAWVLAEVGRFDLEVPHPARQVLAVGEGPDRGLLVLTVRPVEGTSDAGQVVNDLFAVHTQGPSPRVTQLWSQRSESPVRLVVRSLVGEPHLLILGAEGRVTSLGRVGRGPRVEEARVLLSAGLGELAATVGEPGSGIAVARAGEAIWWRVDDHGELAAMRWPAPVRAELHDWGLELVSPPATQIPGAGGRPDWLVLGPEAAGRQRLRTTVLPAAGERFEAWAQLPREEHLVDATYDLVDGEPMWVVYTAPTVGAFVKRTLSILPFGSDLTRSGLRPRFRVDLDCYTWAPSETHLTDLDEDGRQDLVILHPEGLGSGDLVVRWHRGLGGGRFETRAEQVKVETRDSPWRYGEDLTGDGRPDLVVWASDLELYPGAPGEAIGSRRPSATARLERPEELRVVTLQVGGDGAERQDWDEEGDLFEVLDVDGDGVAEVVLAWEGQPGLTLLRF